MGMTQAAMLVDSEPVFDSPIAPAGVAEGLPDQASSEVLLIS